MISPETAGSPDNEFIAIGADVQSISEVPSDLKLNLPEHLASAQPYKRISRTGIIDIVMLKMDSGKNIACFCFAGNMRTFQIGDENQLRAEVMRALKLNIKHHEDIEMATKDLEIFVEENQGGKNIVTDFPADLENSESGGNFPNSYFTRETKRQILRVDFPNGTTFLIAWPPSAKSYMADVYKNNKYVSSSNDFDLSNLKAILKR